MNILQVNLQDMPGGAAQVALNLHKAYRARGHQVQMAVSRKRGDDPSVFEIQHDHYKNWVTRQLIRLGQKLESLSPRIRGTGHLGGYLLLPTEMNRNLNLFMGREDFYAPGTRHLLDMASGSVDIMHLHNLHKDWLGSKREYFDLRELPGLSQRVPIVLTLHDAWLLSGHCAHSFECDRWLSGCGNCPDLTIYPAIKRDATAQNWKLKQKIFAQSQLHVAAPSRWLLEKAEKSILAGGMLSSRVIPNGVDQSIFHPGKEDRRALGLPEKARILLFTADGIKINPFKDFETLRQALNIVAEHLNDVLLIALGEEGPTETIGNSELRFIPFQQDPVLLSRYYRAADVYIHASKADTFPNSIIEALSCGTPVVATAVGGIPEQIIDGKTGFLTKKGDVSAMAKRIEEILTNPTLELKMKTESAQDAKERFGLDQEAEAYLNWYRDIVENNKKG